MRLIELTEAERAELVKQHRYQGDDAKAADKIKAILLLADGYSRQKVSRILLRDEDTITRWKETYKTRKTISDWFDEDYTGYGGKLSAEQLKAVETQVENNIVQSAQTVQQWIQTQFTVSYSISGIHALLHRLGFTYKQSKPYPSKMDSEAQELFKEMYETAEGHLKEGVVVLFADAVHPQHNTHSVGVWVKKGEDKWIPSNTGRKHLNINGAYNPHTQDVVIHEDKVVNAQTTIHLFEKVETAYPLANTIYMFVDNAPYYRSQLLAEYVKTSKIELVFLPGYSPNLNLIERLWKFLKRKVINTHYYESFPEFKQAILDFFDNIHEYKNDLKQAIGTKMRLIHPQPLTIPA
jgi:transposase